MNKKFEVTEQGVVTELRVDDSTSLPASALFCERSEQLWLRVKGPDKQRQIVDPKVLSGIFLNTL
jgi:hypothetical protein